VVSAGALNGHDFPEGDSVAVKQAADRAEKPGGNARRQQGRDEAQ